MEKKFRIVAIAKSDAWFDGRSELIGKTFIVSEAGYANHKGSGWYAADGKIEKPTVPGGTLRRCFFRVKLANIEEA